MVNKTIAAGALLMLAVAAFVAHYLPELTEKQAATARTERLKREADAPSGASASSQNASTSSVEGTAATVAAKAIQNLVDALQKGAKISLSHVAFAADLRSPLGASVTAAHDMRSGDTIVELPSSLQFNRLTMHPHLKKGLEAIAATNAAFDAMRRDPRNNEFDVIMSLLLGVRQQSKSQWAPYLLTLPSAAFVEKTSPLFFLEDDMPCMSRFDQRIVQDIIQTRDRLLNMTALLCQSAPPTDAAAMPKTPENLVYQLACHTTEGHMSWAYGVFLARRLEFAGTPSMFPLLDMLPYSIDANVRPGSIQTDDNGRYVSVGLVAAKEIPAGTPLTFRMGVRHPSVAFFETGRHTSAHYEPLGLMLPLRWSEAVRDISAATLQCGVDERTYWIPIDGKAHDSLWQCAELEETVQSLLKAKSAGAEGSDAVVSAAELEEFLVSTGKIESNSALPTLSVAEETKSSLRTYVGDEYSVSSCTLSEECTSRRLCAELVEHTTYMQNILEAFQES